MNSKTIARNTAWYGLENLIGFVTGLITSIAIARNLGPAKMGYIIYVTWIVGIVASLGGVGIPATTRKYMAEFLGASDFATGRFIYIRTLLIQASLATVATLGAVVWVLRDSPADYRVAALMLVLSIWPSMVNSVPAQANVASEKLSANLPASLYSTATYFIFTMLAILLHWGVNGIAFAMLAMRIVDWGVRIVPTSRRIFSWGKGEPHPPAELRSRMMSFATQSVMGMLLTLVVWDRSELFLLRHLSSDIRQLSFYSVAFNLAERLLIFPTIFAAATGASILAQYGRDRTKLPSMTAASARYIAMISIPLHIIAVPLAAPVLLVLYGKQYIGALVVATAAPILCLPKAFLGPIQSLFESVDRQKYFLVTTVIASFVDIAVAWYLIPAHGALGACLGSGAAQITAVGLMWGIGIRKYRIQLPWVFLMKLAAVSLVSSLGAYTAVSRLSPLWGLIAGSVIATSIFFLLCYVFKMLEPEDRDRFKVISNALPRAIGTPMNYLLDHFTRHLTPKSTAV